MSYIGQKPADKPVVASDLDPAVITGQTALAVAPADTDEFLISDGGVLKRLDASLIGGGKVLQVVSANKSDTWSSSGTGNFQAITGLSLSITPSSASNKIFIVSSVQLSQNDYGGGVSIFRGGSQIVTPASVGSRSVVNASSYAGYAQSSSNLALSYLDSPSSTSALTYQIYAFVRSGTYYVNRSSTDSDTDDFARTISTITAFEIAL
jgi:hypothetical protein